MKNLTCIALAIYSAAYLLLFLTWGALLTWGRAGPEQAQYIAYIRDALLMLTAHILTILNAAPPAAGATMMPPATPATAPGDQP